MPELWGLRGGYAGTSRGLGGGMPEFLGALGGYARTFGTFGPQASQQSAPHMHVLVCICSNVRQFH